MPRRLCDWFGLFVSRTTQKKLRDRFVWNFYIKDMVFVMVTGDYILQRIQMLDLVKGFFFFFDGFFTFVSGRCVCLSVLVHDYFQRQMVTHM